MWSSLLPHDIKQGDHILPKPGFGTVEVTWIYPSGDYYVIFVGCPYVKKNKKLGFITVHKDRRIQTSTQEYRRA